MKEQQPQNVAQVLPLIQKEFGLSEDDAMKRVLRLRANGELFLKDQAPPSSQRAYLLSLKAAWFWIVVALSIASSVSVFIISDGAYPLAYLRYVFGSVLVLFLPGFCLIKALFPQKTFDEIERVMLSVGLSLVVVPLLGLFLNYTAWGITVFSLIVSLVPFALVSASVGILREYRAQKPEL